VPDLSFAVDGAEPLRFAAAPQLALKLRVVNQPDDQLIHAVVLRSQVQIEAAQRSYDEDEREGLRDLFGEDARWGRTLRSLLWTQASLNVPAFTGSVVADLILPCSYDFNLATTKLFHALRDGEVPLSLQFSGTVFYADASGALQVAQIPWSAETSYRLAVPVWRETMTHYYPSELFVGLRKDVFEQLYRYRVRNGLPSWEHTLERLLARERETP
jgi:hypothetical protein